MPQIKIKKRLSALITGATGYIGSRLAERLVREGWTVHALVRPQAHLERLPAGLHSVAIHHHDGSTESMLSIVGLAKPDVTFHLASLYLREHASHDVENLITSNVLLGAELAEALSKLGFPNFVNTGTAWQHYKDKAYNPVSLYAATKQAFDDILEYYRDCATIKTVALQIFDTYGPDDPRPKLLSVLQKAGPTPMDMVDGRQMIHMVYIDDIMDAYLVAARRLLKGSVRREETYALYSRQAVTIKQLVNLYMEATGKKLALNWGARPYKEREVMIPWKGGRRLPGWKPKTGLKEGLKKTAGL